MRVLQCSENSPVRGNLGNLILENNFAPQAAGWMNDKLACLGIAEGDHGPEGDHETLCPLSCMRLVGQKQCPLKPTPNNATSSAGDCSLISHRS